MTLKLRLGTRKSALALAQSTAVARTLEALHPGLRVELVTFETRGDRTAGLLAPLGGKGLFTEELESGLLDGSLDLAVHSLKDLPVGLPEELVVAAYPERADPRDVLVSEAAAVLEGLPPGSVVLTGALRRQAQVLAANPALRVEGVRGNVQTRLRRWRESAAGGVVLAAAGLARLGLLGRDDLPVHSLDPERFVPAPGQGTLAVEVRSGSEAEELVLVLNHPPTAVAADAERRVVAAFGGNCALPLAAWARPVAGEGAGGAGLSLTLTGLLATPDGRRIARAEVSAGSPEEAAAACVGAMREAGAAEILERIGSPLTGSQP
ncbi:MAG TPA: hydroxymethylbilane synthase [Thermoanaerobaculia bacterium]|nr:hydroxymethylbilane synthase [Thermoanaerobaculia bacterium]